MNPDVRVFILELLRLVSLTALAAPAAKSSTPATGLVTVPTTPRPRPVIKPCEYRSKLHVVGSLQHEVDYQLSLAIVQNILIIQFVFLIHYNQ